MFGLFNFLKNLVSSESITTNPANGLQMIDDVFDVAGNVWGTTEQSETFNSSMSSFD